MAQDVALLFYWGQYSRCCLCEAGGSVVHATQGSGMAAKRGLV